MLHMVMFYHLNFLSINHQWCPHANSVLYPFVSSWPYSGFSTSCTRQQPLQELLTQWETLQSAWLGAKQIIVLLEKLNFFTYLLSMTTQTCILSSMMTHNYLIYFCMEYVSYNITYILVIHSQSSAVFSGVKRFCLIEFKPLSHCKNNWQ